MNFNNLYVGIFFVFVIVFIFLFSVLPNTSTRGVYIGYLNDSTLELSNTACGDNIVVGIDGGCNHLTVYCEKYWYPYHCFSHCFDGDIECHWRSNKR